MPIILGNHIILTQLFTNLISNAIKHHGNDNGHIQVSAKHLNNQWYEFCIADDGVGVDPAFHDRIFQLFQTLKPKDEVESTGIGLTLCKKIVQECCNGTMRVESNTGKGAKFYFTWRKHETV
jgi:light-regulated signal transduction histidine kinase (bacteriophytochrome)